MAADAVSATAAAPAMHALAGRTHASGAATAARLLRLQRLQRARPRVSCRSRSIFMMRIAKTHLVRRAARSGANATLAESVFMASD